ncbi:DCXR [Cordylochernes scorpioides]|uniref:DCXR n=1 Tax=Cordylochernes scorpioides TaxID=51811 RepID=A0ABY6L7C3_9ARAC|nr:DCXR [Cordylochernes scorpioides]
MPGHRKRRQFKQTDAFTRGMVIKLKRAGWSIRQIAADTHLGASTVHRLWRRWLEQGNVAIYRNVGATRVTSARVDRRILRQAVVAPQATCTAILQHVQDTLDHSISTRTISRRLVANGLHSCRPLRRLPLTPPNRRQRLEWCRARSTWMTEWHRVVFSDESRFCLSSDSRRVRVWRRRGERSNPAAIVERPTVRQRGIMVWGAIAYDSSSPLLRIQGTMTAQRYVDDVLRPVTLPYLQGVPNALYQQDNARPHTARISQQALQDVQMLPWPPYSPDLSPIEHVWDIIGMPCHSRDAIRTLIDSLPRRVAACIAVRGIGRGVVCALAKAGAQVTALARNPDLLKMSFESRYPILATIYTDYPDVPPCARKLVRLLLPDWQEVFEFTPNPLHRCNLHGITSTECPGVRTIAVDLTDWDATKQAVESCGPVDLLVNNAGVASLQSFGSITPEAIDSVFSVNVKAAINVSQVVVEGMKARGGAIVNLSSQASLVALPDHTVYCASKAALDQITKVMALELGPHKIRVNSVCPTVVNTAMGRLAWSDPDLVTRTTAKIPLGRFCEVEDVVAAVMFLLSDGAAMITGSCLPVDGGYTVA